MFRETRERSHSIGLGQRDSMSGQKTLPHMKPVVLAKHDPAIIGVFPHMLLRPPSPGGGLMGEDSGIIAKGAKKILVNFSQASVGGVGNRLWGHAQN